MKKILLIGKTPEILLEALKAAKYELVFENSEKENIKGMEFDAVFIEEAAPFDYNKIPIKKEEIL